eukprot:6211285-Pleurochrysis_carterae.AAC.1
MFDELAPALSLQHLKAIAGLVWQGTEVDALVCARLQLASLQCIRAVPIRLTVSHFEAAGGHSYANAPQMHLEAL